MASDLRGFGEPVSDAIERHVRSQGRKDLRNETGFVRHG